MNQNITFRGITYDLSTPSGMASYSAAINNAGSTTPPVGNTGSSSGGTGQSAPETPGRGAGGNHYNSSGVIVDRNNTPIPPDPSQPTASATWINFQNRNYNLADPNDMAAYRTAINNGNTSNNTNSSSGGTGTNNTNSSSSPVPNPADPNYQSQLDQLLANPDLSPDQVTALREYFTVVAENDSAAATRMIGAFNTGIAFSSPVFQSQIRMLTDALQQGLSGITGNLANSEESLRNQRDKLVEDMTASNEMLDFNSQQQLQNLRTSFDQNIETNAQNQAATGRASSSVRLKSDALLNQNYNGLVESNNRTLAYNRSNNLRDINYTTEQTNLEIQRLRDKATVDRIAALRDAEGSLGSEGLGNIPGLNLTGNDVLGGISSTIERDRLRDAFGFATNFF